MRRRERVLVPGVLFFLFALLVVRAIPRGIRSSLAQHTAHEWTTLRCEHMATVIGITVPDDGRSADALRILSDACAEVERDMNEWKPGSPLAEVNRLAGVEPVVVPPDLIDLVQRGIALAEATGGAFDPTWAALWGVWDFRGEHPSIPDTESIERATTLIDYRRIEIDRDASTLYLPQSGMKIGLGGIAKGYAIDLAAERLRDAGFQDFIITGGGQVCAAGAKGDRPWRVGIRDPRGPADDLFATVELHDASLSTSGDYERFFIIDGVRYHHILDPRTGRPGDSPRSVTVLSPDAALADAVSTALMIVEPDQRERVLRETGVSWALFVEQTGAVTQIGATPPGLTIVHAPRPE